ncbi:hypothetical protein C8R44DRAFT_973746 [Mycena epipterygia]|nr:hypothetical protein C8R44DRAFT_973746 [Mycena epipterygia]
MELLSERLNDLEKRVVDMEERIADHSGRLEGLDSRVDDLEEAAAQLAALVPLFPIGCVRRVSSILLASAPSRSLTRTNHHERTPNIEDPAAAQKKINKTHAKNAAKLQTTIRALEETIARIELTPTKPLVAHGCPHSAAPSRRIPSPESATLGTPVRRCRPIPTHSSSWTRHDERYTRRCDANQAFADQNIFSRGSARPHHRLDEGGDTSSPSGHGWRWNDYGWARTRDEGVV